LLALSLFDFYDIRLPNFLQKRLHQQGRGGRYWGVIVMGAIATLILSPCVSAPLVGVLSYIGETGDAVLGGFALWLIGFGMGIPLLLIGTGGGRFLPKTGYWMHLVKVLLGVVLLGLSNWLLMRILPMWSSMILWAFLLIACGTYLGAFEASPTKGFQRLWKSLGLGLFSYGIFLLVGVALGSDNPLRPLAVLNHTSAAVADEDAFETIRTPEALRAVLAEAKQKQQAVLIDFYAKWCVSCHLMDQQVFGNAEIQHKLKAWRRIRFDVTENSTDIQQVEAQYQIVAPPTVLFIGPNGVEKKEDRLIGEVSPETFTAIVDKLSYQS
jgi:thiol:disulfide interchange protein DsbD